MRRHQSPPRLRRPIIEATPEPTPTPEPTIEATPEPTPTPEPTVPAVLEPEDDALLAFDPSVVRGTLSNGLSYYVRHNEEPQGRAQISLAVKARLRPRDGRRAGPGPLRRAHGLQRQPTERFAKQEIIEYLESIGSTFGPDLNARTGFDDTLYFFEIPTDDPEITERAFQILSDWAFSIAL